MIKAPDPRNGACGACSFVILNAGGMLAISTCVRNGDNLNRKFACTLCSLLDLAVWQFETQRTGSLIFGALFFSRVLPAGPVRPLPLEKKNLSVPGSAGYCRQPLRCSRHRSSYSRDVRGQSRGLLTSLFPDKLSSTPPSCWSQRLSRQTRSLYPDYRPRTQFHIARGFLLKSSFEGTATPYHHYMFLGRRNRDPAWLW